MRLLIDPVPNFQTNKMKIIGRRLGELLLRSWELKD